MNARINDIHQDRLAVVVGGGNGIGAATAALMHAHGWRVFVTDIDVASASNVAREIGGLCLEMDISEEDSVRRGAQEIEEVAGPVSALVVAAAIFQDLIPTEKLSLDTWEKILRVNLTGTFLANRIFGRGMVQRGSGSIVNVASIAAISSMPSQAYGSSKAAVVQFSRNLAGEWGRSGVRVNVVSPGSTLVARVEKRLESGRYAAHPAEFTALGRIVEPNEVAEAIEFLASERASAITGVNLVVDAGWHVASSWSQFGGVPGSRASSDQTS